MCSKLALSSISATFSLYVSSLNKERGRKYILEIMKQKQQISTLYCLWPCKFPKYFLLLRVDIQGRALKHNTFNFGKKHQHNQNSTFPGLNNDSLQKDYVPVLLTSRIKQEKNLKKDTWGSLSILYGIPAFLHQEKISHCHKILFQILFVLPPVSHSHELFRTEGSFPLSLLIYTEHLLWAEQIRFSSLMTLCSQQFPGWIAREIHNDKKNREGKRPHKQRKTGRHCLGTKLLTEQSLLGNPIDFFHTLLISQWR